MQKEFKITGDGSHTLYVPELNEHYHSTHGAIRESSHIFIHAGLKSIDISSDPINILEIGFGTGLNALLTFLEAKKNNQTIYYTGIEAHPLDRSVYEKLNYCSLIREAGLKTIFLKLHEAEWDETECISEKFILEKIHRKIEDFIPDNNRYNIVYFDAFSPAVQPDIWTEEIFKKIAKSMLPGGILVSYSTKGDVKRALKASGFTIKKLPGPKGKREILRAVKNKSIETN
ncbi:MAG: tRNA (5-methylaminomethyl-2-thiouridine)(34)-methyltransferase MnmD [Bacteroidia bacterium]|nr:tRNA (5-methylaminomethyl-2-thiouridine)(34)-methyltransferase MnmD [Bacteroidia bacterium]